MNGRSVLLASLEPAERRLILALLAAADAKEKTARAIVTPRAAKPAAIDADRPDDTSRSHRRADASG